jgi:hypothetical protein
VLLRHSSSFLCCAGSSRLACQVVSASHGWIRLFTTAPETSGRALIKGVIWSIVFGWVVAAVMVPIYNKIASA